MTLNRNHREPKVGDKVAFDISKVELFKVETRIDSNEIKLYQKLVLEGVNQVGIVTSLNGNLANLSYPDGWELPVPIKYLIVQP